MGWFDDDDDDDDDESEEEQQQNSKKPAQQNDEDPLDAYMNSLKEEDSRPPRAERLDVDNAEEATSHWEVTDDIAKNEKISGEDGNSPNEAQEALASTFHKAGAKKNDDKEFNITLDSVVHNDIKYEDFRKVFRQPKDSEIGRQWRMKQRVICKPTTIDPITKFLEIDELLGTPLSQTITKSGFQSPTPVQAQTLSVALAGRDALVTALTGSGKTLAYVWPMVVHVCDQRSLDPGEGPIAVVLAPTREIAIQVQKQVKPMIHALSGRSLVVTGGTNRYETVLDFKRNGCEVIVATPGRFLDLLSVKKNGISLKRVTFLVLDECDRMLDMGFEAQVKQILQNIRPDRQTLLLSATLGTKIEKVARQWLTDPIRIAVGETGRASDHVEQHVMVLPNFEAKRAWTKEMVPILAEVGQTLIFVATREDCETLARAIREANSSLVLETLHGDKHSSGRQAALRAFGKGRLSALIATDVAARGLDVNVSSVVCFDPAKNLDTHIHRIGRAGRLAKDEQNYRKGTAYTLLTPKDANFAHVLMNSFQREKREISRELRELAHKSKKFGNEGSREKWNKAGLGFTDRESFSSSAEMYHGTAPSRDDPKMPVTKKSRWG